MRNTRWTRFLGIAFTGVNTLFVSVANAQIIPDTTLPNNSQVNRLENINKIEGGTTAGGNLFHSFKEFSIPTGSEAHFNNAVDISNIITRVTGKSISNIDGFIISNGNANLFLINPYGIVFGENALLNIGGSLLVTTSETLRFDDGINFSTNSSQTKPLLSVNVPLGLQFGENPGSLINKSGIYNYNDNVLEGWVKPGKLLAFIGGDIKLDGGQLKASEGQIELAAVGKNSYVSLRKITEGWDFNYEGVENFQDIGMSQHSSVDTSGLTSGIIQIKGKTITLSDESMISAYTFGSKYGQNVFIDAQDLILKDGSQIAVGANGIGKSGSLLINSSNSIQLIGTNTDNFFNGLTIQSYGSAKSGDMTINTKELVVKGGGQIVTSTYSLDNALLGKKAAGDLDINASDSIKLTGTTAIKMEVRRESEDNTVSVKEEYVAYPSTISSESFGIGNAGDLNIKTNNLIIENGANISTASRFLGVGGNLNISSDLVKITGSSKEQEYLSSLFTESTFLRNAGSLNIDTKQLILSDGGRISGSFMDDIALSLVIAYPSTKVITYSFVSVPSFSENNFISSISLFNQLFDSFDCSNCEPHIFTNGRDIRHSNQHFKDIVTKYLGLNIDYEPVLKNQHNASNININALEKIEISGTTPDGKIPTLLFANTLGNGNAGSVKINTNQLTIKDKAQIAVNSQGNGNAGDLEIKAHSIRLQNQAKLSADTTSNQGNINLQSHDLLLLNGSNITTNAKGGNVIGGNININSGVIAAIPIENSDISANSTDSRGGNIRIQSQGIYGIQFRDELTPKSDITATGANPDLPGFVEIITPDTNPNNGLVNLPSIPVETEVAQVCAAGSAIAQSSFKINETIGLPTLPSEALTTDAVLVDLVTLKPKNYKNPSARVSIKPTTSKPKKIIEATGFSKNEKGEIFLVADASSSTNPQINQNVGCSKKLVNGVN